MEKSFLITEDNLIGSLASAMHQLKKMKHKRKNLKDFSFFLELFDFLDKVKNQDFIQLLYDKNFIISEDVLDNIHNEFNQPQISEIINFEELKASLSKITVDSSVEEIESQMKKIKDICMILLQMKKRKEIYM